MIWTDELRTERFWSKVDRSGGDQRCWIWLGALNTEGYGVCRLWGVNGAHRVAYYLTQGDPAGHFVLHSCPGGDNPACCNPAHLRIGTPFENSQDMKVRGRRGGHPETMLRVALAARERVVKERNFTYKPEVKRILLERYDEKIAWLRERIASATPALKQPSLFDFDAYEAAS